MQNRKALLVLGLALGVPLIAALALDFASGIGPEASQYDSRLKTAKALGFDPGFKARLAGDAAKPADARKAFEALEALLKNPESFRLADPAKPATNGRKDLSPAEVRANLRRAAELARRAEGGSHRPWEQGFSMLFPVFAQIKGATRAADRFAREAALKGDYAGATDALLEGADLWRAYRDDPVLISDLVRTACGAILFRTAGALLADPAYPPAQAERLFRMAEGPAFAQTVPLRDFLISETVSGHDILDSPEQFGELMRFDDIGTTDRTLAYGAKLARVRRAWQSDGLRIFIATARALPSDPYDFDASAKAWRTMETEVEKPRGLKGKFTEMLFPVFSQWTQASRNRESQRRVLRMAAGLRAGRSESSLRSSPMATDPGDARPLRLKPNAPAPPWLLGDRKGGKKGGPYLPVAKPLTAIYAVGRDGNDDGGKSPAKPNDPGDEVLVIPSPKPSPR